MKLLSIITIIEWWMMKLIKDMIEPLNWISEKNAVEKTSTCLGEQLSIILHKLQALLIWID